MVGNYKVLESIGIDGKKEQKELSEIGCSIVYVVEDNTINGEVTEENKNIKIDEATLAQLLIEKKLTNQDLKNNYNMSNEQIQKINQTANTFTEILDYLYNKMNEEQIKYGYSPIGKLNNYFPHFFENKPDTMLGKIASYFGIDYKERQIKQTMMH